MMERMPFVIYIDLCNGETLLDKKETYIFRSVWHYVTYPALERVKSKQNNYKLILSCKTIMRCSRGSYAY